MYKDFIETHINKTELNTNTLNIKIKSTPQATEAGNYVSVIESINHVPSMDGDKVFIHYKLKDHHGKIFIFSESFICSSWNSRWNSFSDYLLRECGFNDDEFLSAIIGMTEELSLDRNGEYLNIVSRTKSDLNFEDYPNDHHPFTNEE